MIHALISCASCARHVRVSEAQCPFCSAPIDASGVDPVAPSATPGPRLSRAALFALGAAAALAGCNGSLTPPPDPPTMVAEPTGAPTPPPPSPTPAPTPPSPTAQPMMARYGAPPAPLDFDEV